MADVTDSEPSSRPRRRTVLAAIGGGAAVIATGFLAACTGGGRPKPTPTTTPAPTATPSGPATWAALGAVLGDRLLRSDSDGWTAATRLQNPRFDGATPLGIARVSGPDDVAACIAFAVRSGTPLAVRAGGHSYTGWSAGGAPGTKVPDSLVVDTGTLDDVTLSADGGSVTVGPGATLIAVYRTLAAAGRAIGAGSCPTVGVAGLTLGGGVGVLSRSLGLTCDQLTSVEIVTADGKVRTASADSEPDLFWACRGGSGGTVGVVTSMTFATVAAPAVTRFQLVFPWASAASAVEAWQRWAPDADDRLWSTIKLLNGSRYSRPTVTVSGTWTGDAGALDGLLAPFLSSVGTAPTGRTVVTMTYGDAMDFFAGTTGIPTAACTTGAGGRLRRVPQAATSHVARASIARADIATMVSWVSKASSVDGLLDGGVALDALGGAVGRVSAADSAFPWRDARYDVQYTAVFAAGADPGPFDTYVRGFRSAMHGAFGDTGYANYVDAAVTDPSVYFGDNTARLRKVVAEYGAGGVFRQPGWV